MHTHIHIYIYIYIYSLAAADEDLGLPEGEADVQDLPAMAPLPPSSQLQKLFVIHGCVTTTCDMMVIKTEGGARRRSGVSSACTYLICIVV